MNEIPGQAPKEKIDYSHPFLVRILEDCRSDGYGPSGNLDGKYGMCLGLYDFPNTDVKLEDGDPLIITGEGDLIWGLECWWDPNPRAHADIPVDLQQELVQETKQNYRRLFGLDIEISIN